MANLSIVVKPISTEGLSLSTKAGLVASQISLIVVTAAPFMEVIQEPRSCNFHFLICADEVADLIVLSRGSPI